MVPSFRKGSKVTKFIHVLVNCIAVMPFHENQEEEETTPNSNLLSPGERNKKKIGNWRIERKKVSEKKAGSQKERARSAKGVNL